MKLIYRCLCLALGTILGAGCDSETPVEYGQPHATLSIDGHVRDQLGAPIPGIEVDCLYAPPDTSDADGAWAIHSTSAPDPCASDSECSGTLYATDIDGPENGTFDTLEFEYELEQTDEGSGSWDRGTFEQHDIDLEMTEQKPREKGRRP